MIKWFNKKKYIKNKIEIDNNLYDVFVREKIFSRREAVRIVVVSYQPNRYSSELLKLFIESIKKFTDSDYELWVVDNNSPAGNIEWIDDVKDINTAFIRTEPGGGASYANALALEIATRLINPGTGYLVCFHEDVVVCRYGWLSYMLFRVDGKVKAAGFRLTTARVPEGVLHVCGYMIDFQLFRKLELSFLPELPQFDVGDKAIYLLRKNGFDIFHTPNTFDSPGLVSLIPKAMEAYDLNVTRSFNDRNEIIYMHLGRGIPKAKGEYKNKEKSSSEQWSGYIRKNLLSEPFSQFVEPGKVDEFDFLDTSIREFYVKSFIADNLNSAAAGVDVFYYGEESNEPDKKELNIKYQTVLPSGGQKFNCVIFPEMAKDKKDTGDILEWAWENLVSGGILLLTIPIPDYGGSKEEKGFDDFLKLMIERLWNTGFKEVSVTKQGSSSSLKLDSELGKLKVKIGGLDKNKAGIIINSFVKRKLKNVLKAESRRESGRALKVDNITTGYGIRAVK